MNNSYVYVYLDPRKKGKFIYGEYEFEYQPFYVGQGKGRRYRKHFLEAKKNNIMNNAFKFNVLSKLLRMNLEPIIFKICENISENEAKDLEIFLINKIGRKEKGGILTNLTDGGEGTSGFIMSKEQKELIRKSCLGRKHTEEHKQFMSELMKNRKLSKETREKISKAKKGKKHSEETKQKWSDMRKGKNHPNYGKKLSEETKRKIGNSNKGRIVSKKEREERSERMKGLLVGEKNPMFGKTGDKNPNAKKYILISPDKEKYEICGIFIRTIKEFGLNESYLRETLNTKKPCEKKGKTNGWILIKNED